MAPQIKGRKMKSIADARKTSKGGGGEGFITYIGEDGLMLRLLAEPDEWWGYTEHYDDVLGSFPCVEGDCHGCANGDKGAFRYLVPAVGREDDKVLIVKVPKSLAQDLVTKYDRRKTLLDRDYFLYKEGTGKNNTRYKVDDEDTSKFNFGKYKVPNLGAALVASWDRVFGDGEEEDEEEVAAPARRRKVAGNKKAATRRNSAIRGTDDDDEDDEDDRPVRRRTAGKSSTTKRRTVRR